MCELTLSTSQISNKHRSWKKAYVALIKSTSLMQWVTVNPGTMFDMHALKMTFVVEMGQSQWQRMIEKSQRAREWWTNEFGRERKESDQKKQEEPSEKAKVSCGTSSDER